MGRRDNQGSFFDTRFLCERLIPQDSFYYKFRQHRDKFIKDEDFSTLYCLNNGRPSVPPSILCSTMLLQYYDNVSDREAVNRLIFDLRWKYALDLPVNYEGFDHSRLVRFRAKLLIYKKERMFFDNVLQIAQETGILKENFIQIIDSSHILGAAAVQDTFTLIRESIRKLFDTINKKNTKFAEELKELLKCEIGKKAEIDWGKKEEREKHLQELVTDAQQVLKELKLSGLGNDGKIQEKAELLCDILNQDITTDEDGNSEIKKGVAKDRIPSTNDPEMRHGRKSSSHKFDGYKTHICEDPETELITNIGVTAGNVHDSEPSLELITEQEETISLKTKEVIGDCAYGTGDNRARFKEKEIKVVSKVPTSSNRGYYPKEDFIIDLKNHTIKCPAGEITGKYSTRKDNKGRLIKCFKFPGKTCSTCPHAQKCTKNPSKGRTITLNYHEDLLQEAREEQKTEEFKEKYRLRPIVERKIGELMHQGLRNGRYKGTIKTSLQAFWTATVVNLKKIFKLLDRHKSEEIFQSEYIKAIALVDELLSQQVEYVHF